MKIAIIDIIGIPYDGTTVFRQGLGGSESAVTLVGIELQKLGFEVTVFNHCDVDHARPGIYDGVTYRPLPELAQDHVFDVVISSRTVIPFVDPADYNSLNDNRCWPYHSMNLYDRILSKAKMRILWMHDTFCLGDAMIEGLAVSDRITDIFTLSDWHLTYITNCDHGRKRNFEVLKKKVSITRNGARNYIPEVDIAAKDRNLFVYNASVSKGMVPLVEDIWPHVKRHIPEAQLKIIGGYYRFSSGDMPDEQELRWRTMAEDPSNPARGIEFTGIIPQHEIANILARANFMIYPAAFPETYGISTLESMLYNTPSITCRFGALEEIAIEKACYLIDYAIEPNGLFPLIDKAQQLEQFVGTVVRAYKNPYLHQQKQYYCNIVKPVAGWDSVALQWKQLIFHKTQQYLSVAEYRRVSDINHRVHKIWGRRYHNMVELESRRIGNEKPIVIVSPFYNAEQYITRCIESVSAQDYDNYHHILIDDASTDNGFQTATDVISELPESVARKFTVIKNIKNQGAVKNQIDIIRGLYDGDAIVMLLDGDDSLVADNSIFAYYNAIYDENVEFTYGSCWSMVDNIPLISQPYPESVRRQRGYRDHHFNWILPYTHLRTFRKRLIDGLPDSMFQDDHGDWYRAGGDGSVFYALIEAADPDKVLCLQDIVYNYNDVNPLNDYKVNAEEQNRNAKQIIGKPSVNKYSIIVPTMWQRATEFVDFVKQLSEHPLVDEIIIINNDNTKTPNMDNSAGKIQMFDFGRNIFVNPAWNFGVNASRNNLLCILNDDVSFDLDVLGRLQHMLTADAGVFGLCPGESVFNQPPVTTKTIDIIPWTDQHTYGFGCLMFIHKAVWQDIPQGLDIYYGDNFIFDIQLWQGRTNYLITNMDFKTPFAATTSVFQDIDKFLERESPIYDRIRQTRNNTINMLPQLPPDILELEYQAAINAKSDISDHIPKLRALATECSTVTEFGVRTGASTRAFLPAPSRLRSYDLYIDDIVMNLFNIARSQGKDCSYTAASTLDIDIEPTEMLFIDTDHHALHLAAELRRHHHKVSKYLVFHDTHTFGLVGDTYWTKIPDNRGLLSAVIDFVIEHPEWQFDYYSTENNGLTVLKRTNAVSLPVSAPPVPAGTKKRILIAIPTAKNIEVDTFKSIYDLVIPEGYTADFQYFFGYNIDQIRNLIAHWASNYDYLFSVDSDIAFDSDTLVKLLAHDRDVVSGLYIQRKFGHHILEIYEHNGHGGVVNIPYEKIKNQGLVEIAGCGFGCVLVKSQVFRDVGYPQFEYHSALDHANTISEDNDFCRKAREHGFKIYADTSIQCRHIGNYTFTVDNNIDIIAELKKKL